VRYRIRLTENEKRDRKAIIEDIGFSEFGINHLLVAVLMIVCKVEIQFNLSFRPRWLRCVSDTQKVLTVINDG
jgi:hypothetical protein